MAKARHYIYFLRQILQLNFSRYYRAPLIIRISLTNRCNNNCVYCSTHDLSQSDCLTTDHLKAIMSEMKKCGTRRLHFIGGEPMMRSDIGELIRYAKKLEFFVSMNTNGYQIAKRVDEIKDIDLVTLSYDGPAHVHNRLRYPQDVAQVDSAIKILKSRGVAVWTNTVLTKWNTEYIEDIIRHAKEYCVIANFSILNFISGSRDHFRPSHEKVKELVLEQEEREKCMRKLISLKNSGAPIGSSMGFLKAALEWPHNDRVVDSQASKRYKCWAGRAFGYLDARGMLYPCLFHYNSMPGISASKDGFQVAWRNLQPPKNCLSCLHPCGVEMNLLCSLNFSAIKNWSKKIGPINCGVIDGSCTNECTGNINISSDYSRAQAFLFYAAHGSYLFGYGFRYSRY